MTAANESVAPASAQSAVLMRSEPIPEGTRQAGGPIFDTQDPNDLGALMASMETIGFQGTSVAEACLLYTSPSPRDGLLSRMPSSA